MKAVMLFLVTIILVGCASEQVKWTNPNIPVYDEKKKKEIFEEDKTLCTAFALKAVPIQNTPIYNDSGSFEVRNLYTGNVYHGTYRSGYGLANAIAKLPSDIMEVKMIKLRKKLFDICMKKKGWKKVPVINNISKDK